VSTSISTFNNSYAKPRLTRLNRFISDIGAQELKPLFMIGCITTVLLLNLSFYQYVQNKGYINKMCTYGSFFFTVVGSIGLVMLSVFDNIVHHFMHDVCVTIFMSVSSARLRCALLTVLVWGTSSVQP
jgi:hypothetical protein